MEPSRQPLERRAMEGQLLALEQPEGRRVAGLAALFETDTPVAHGLIERLAPTAFAKLGQGRDIKLLVGHDGGQPLASQRAGTLALRVEPQGLRFSGLLADTPRAREVWESVKRRDLSGVSIGFRVRPGGERWERRGTDAVRTLTDLDVFEISLTAIPVQQETYVEAYALAEARSLLGPVVDRLRDPRARLQLAHARVALAEALHPLPEWKERELEERAYHERLKAEYRARERLQRGDR